MERGEWVEGEARWVDKKESIMPACRSRAARRSNDGMLLAEAARRPGGAPGQKFR
jgi:hypothetical protein